MDAGLAEADAPRSEKVHGITQAIGGSFEQKTIEPHVYAVRISSSAAFSFARTVLRMRSISTAWRRQ